MLDTRAHCDDVIRSAEEDRENAKGRKRETETETEPDESPDFARPQALVRSYLSTVALPSFALSPFRAFAIPFPKASPDVQVKRLAAAET